MKDDFSLRIILGVVLAALLIVRFYYLAIMSRAFKAGAEDYRETGISALLPSALANIGLAAVGIYILLPGWMDWSRLPMPGWGRWIGVALSIGGLVLFCWTHLALGRNFSWNMKLRKEHQLVTGGPYRWVRHPMYTALLAMMSGFFLGSANWFIGLMLIIPTIAILIWRLDREEAMLLETFGESYRAYMQRTGRLLPKLLKQE